MSFWLAIAWIGVVVSPVIMFKSPALLPEGRTSRHDPRVMIAALLPIGVGGFGGPFSFFVVSQHYGWPIRITGIYCLGAIVGLYLIGAIMTNSRTR